MTPEKIVRLDESAIGSTLSRVVHGDGTVVVCSAGARLNGRTLLKLKRAGISSVYVKRELALGGNDSVTNRLLELDRKFARVENEPTMRALKRAVAERIKEKAGGGA
jgi:hypothetical protein